MRARAHSAPRYITSSAFLGLLAVLLFLAGASAWAETRTEWQQGKHPFFPSSLDLLGATPSPTPACGLAWRVVSSPNTTSETNYLRGVEAVSPTEAWAVGAFADSNGASRALIMRWDGAEWSLIPTPHSSSDESYLRDATAISADDVWAVGKISRPQQTLTEHWDDAQWTIIPSPNPAFNNSNELFAVDAVASNDVWAVGAYVSGNYWRSLIEHWDGTEWSVVPSPNPSPRDNLLRGVSAVSANDVWAVGHYRPISPAHDWSLTMHWDGNQWSVVPSPNVPNHTQNILLGVSALSSNDVWAVGWMDGGLTLSMHWDGVEWKIVSTPHVGSEPNYLQAVSGVASNNVWAIGHYISDRNRTLILHWDGVEWRHIPSPSPYGFSNQLFGVSALSADDVWAVGYGRDCFSGCPWVSLVLRYNDPCVPPPPTRTPRQTLTSTLTPTYTPSPVPSLTPTIAVPTFTPTSTAVLTSTPTPSSAPTSTGTPCAISFTDVDPGDYFYEAVRYLYCLGVVSGYEDRTFRPYIYTTRGQLCKIVTLAEGWSLYAPPLPTFTDVPTEHPFYAYIETAYFQGVISGYADGTFRPYSNVTRGQLCKIVVLARRWTINTQGGPHFDDVPVGDTFYPYVETAYNQAVISGYADRTFRPGNGATRGQIAKIVYDVSISNFADFE